ncbi:MAG TPA: glycosyl hydrolase [Candidatus Hydrogenedentes bacterium]|nr:glycosyl hydrolase [Candidatus Hydrogenedentota bacterium]
MIKITGTKLRDLNPLLERFFALSAPKIRELARKWKLERGAPVFTRQGKYTTRGWTEWTQGFLYGCRILQFDATDDEELLDSGRTDTLTFMAPHVTHIGVHDHGFNNLSTYGNLRRLALEGRTGDSIDLVRLYELAIQASGAVQAARWTPLADGGGFIHSFNGPQSLFVDTIRSCRILVLAHALGHVLMGENDTPISLLDRAAAHIRATLTYNFFYGRGRDRYDVRGRVAHEALFNVNNGAYRCPGTQQGYSPFTTWTRGLAWGLLGSAEQLEFFMTNDDYLRQLPDSIKFMKNLREGARATADFYISNSPVDGVPYWDTGAPGLAQMGDYLDRPSEPDNPWEPVDSSAAAIAAQGLLRLGQCLGVKGDGKRYFKAGLAVARTLFSPPYISENPAHQGLLLHSIYHRPNGWDFTPKGKKAPQGEASMWGDYHAMELAVYLQRLIHRKPYLTFYASPSPQSKRYARDYY